MGFFASQFVSYAMIAWLPTVLTQLGMPLEAGIRAGIVYNACAVVGALLVGPTIARVGSRWTILAVAVLAAVAVTAAPMVVGPGRSAVPVLVAIGLGGFSIGMAIAALYAVTPQAYPATIRATGLGFAVTWGRIAGITTTLVGGVVLTLAAGNAVPFFGMLLVACALVFVAAVVLQRHIPARSAGVR